MKAISFVTAIILAGAVPGFCQTPRRSLSSIFNSKLAFYLPEPDSTPLSSGVLNAGSGNATIAPNTWLAVYGTNLSQQPFLDWSQSDFSHGLPTSLGGVSATVNDKPAAIYFISPGQVNILAPIDQQNAAGTVVVKLTTAFGSTTVNATEQPLSPAFFVLDVPNGHVAARHGDAAASLIGPSTLFPGQSTPAKPGETVALYCTGFGQTNPPVTDQLAGGPLPTLPTVTIGNLPAVVGYAGLSAAGLYQLNVTVPANAPDGDLPLVATYNGVSTQPGVVLAVQH